jgi:hypothetical protein
VDSDTAIQLANILIQATILIISLGAIWIAIRQFRHEVQTATKELKFSQDIAKGQFLLHLDELLDSRKEAHLMLRRGGRWLRQDKVPQTLKECDWTADEWAAVEAYMGFFERVNILVEKDLLDIAEVERLYGYRVRNIVNNPVIFEAKLVEARSGWKDFLSLCDKLRINTDPQQHSRFQRSELDL